MSDDTGSAAFSPDWLALREPADHRARNRLVEMAFLDHLATRGERVAILDLGCGAGSNFRALAPVIAQRHPNLRQDWFLVDADTGLLERAETTTRAFADAQAIDAGLDFVEVDLAGENALASLCGQTDCHVVTGAALIDLVSASWLDCLSEMAAAHRLAAYFVLNYTGEEVWLPPHDLDAAIRSAFLADQRRDKGFGPALGPEAADHLERRLRSAGFDITAGESDWRLDTQSDKALVAALARGIAAAATTSGLLREDAAGRWLDARLKADTATIGHRDIFARLRGS